MPDDEKPLERLTESELAEVKILQALDFLMEHWETVQIQVTRYEGGEDCKTVEINAGRGNIHARRAYMEQVVRGMGREEDWKYEAECIGEAVDPPEEEEEGEGGSDG